MSAVSVRPADFTSLSGSPGNVLCNSSGTGSPKGRSFIFPEKKVREDSSSLMIPAKAEAFAILNEVRSFVLFDTGFTWVPGKGAKTEASHNKTKDKAMYILYLCFSTRQNYFNMALCKPI